MKLYPVFLLLAVGVILAGCGKSHDSHAPAQTNASKDGPLTANADYLGAVAHAQDAAIKSIDISYIKNAINQFQAEEGRFPKDLQELISEQYLTKIPKPPYGYEIKYDATQGTVSVTPLKK
jgi:hypothetical protein